MTEAYPLQWPAGRPRTAHPSRSRFGERSIASATASLMASLRMMRAGNAVLSTNIRLRNDGLPYSNDKPPADKGVAVYFTLKGRPMCFACDRWDKVQDNIYAVAMTIDALRGIERWGSGSMVEQAFTGFVALPAPRSSFDVLGVSRNATHAQIDAAFREKAKTAHPDAGGEAGEMQTLIDARNRAKSGVN